MRNLLLALLALALSLPAAAQAPLVETIEVRVANIDVVVTDKSGKPVSGLTKDDFEIYENGKKQPITNFSEIRTEAPTASVAAAKAPATRPRRFFLFIDVSSIHPNTRDVIVESLRKFAETQLGEEDEASVIAWSGELQVLTHLTSDKSEIASALNKVKGLSSPGAIRNDVAKIQQACNNALQMARGGRLPMQSAYEDCIGTARVETNATVTASRRLLNALGITLSMMGGGEEKKVLVVAGARLPRRPGLEPFNWANNLFTPFLTGFNRPSQVYQEDHPIAEEIAAFTRNANASGVTVYLVNAPGIADPMSTVNKNAYSDEGADFLYATNTSDSFEEIARGTGGAATRTRWNVDSILTTVSQDLSQYYSLGFKPAERLREARKIEVRTKNRELHVRSRQTWTEKSSDDQMSDRVVSNVFNPEAAGDFAVRLRAGKPALAEKNTRKVPIEVVFPSSAITLLPNGTNLDGGFTVWIAVGDRRGALSPVSHNTQPIRVPAAEEKEFRAAPIGFTVDLTMREGENIVSVAIVDKVSGSAAFGRATVVAE